MHTSRMVILHRFVSPFIQLLDAFGILVIPVPIALFKQFLIHQVGSHVNLTCLIANRYDFSCQFSHESGNQQAHDDKCYIAKSRCSFQCLQNKRRSIECHSRSSNRNNYRKKAM